MAVGRETSFWKRGCSPTWGSPNTHSRPYTSDDNPFSEAQFKTLKYRSDFEERFGSIEDARVFCQAFFSWYNGEHHYSQELR